MHMCCVYPTVHPTHQHAASTEQNALLKLVIALFEGSEGLCYP